jgi:hypothetical protein
MADDKKQIQQIAKGHEKKETALDKFTKVFFSADARSVLENIFEDYIVPGIKNTALSAFEMFLFGSTSRRRGGTTHVSYDKSFECGRNTRSNSRMDSNLRSDRYDFSAIELETRGEAESVIFAMQELLDKYDGEATVADLKSLVGVTSNHIDNRWGWRDSRDFGYKRSGRYYVLDFEPPIYLG